MPRPIFENNQSNQLLNPIKRGTVKRINCFHVWNQWIEDGWLRMQTYTYLHNVHVIGR